MKRINFNITILGLAALSIFNIAIVNAQSAKSDSLFAVGVDLYNEGKFKEAIPLFTESDRLDKAEMDLKSNRREYSAMWLASCFYQLGDSIKAEEISSFFKFPPIDRRLTTKSDSLSRLGEKYIEKNDLQNALICWLQCADIERLAVGEKHVWYGNTIISCGDLCYNLKDSVKALSYMKEGAEIIKNNYGSSSSNYADILIILGNIYTTFKYDNNLVEALSYWLKAYEIGKYKIMDSKTLEASIGAISFDIGNDYSNKKEFQKAIDYLNISLSFNDKKDVEDKSDNSVIKIRLANNYAYLGDFNSAIQIMSETLSMLEKTHGKNDTYLICLNNLADFYHSVNNNTETLRLLSEVLDICENLYGKESEAYIEALDKIANCLSYTGNHIEAKIKETEAVQLSTKVHGHESLNRAMLLSRLADFNSYLGDHSEALLLGKEAIGIIEKNMGKDNPFYATALDNLASYNSCIGNYTEALELEQEALQIRERTLGKRHLGYVNSLQHIGSIYLSLYNYSEAIKYEQEALQLYEEFVGKENRYYTNALSKLAECYNDLGNYAEAVKCQSELLAIIKKILGSEHPDYIVTINKLSMYYAGLGKYSEAIHLGTEALQLIEEHWGQEKKEYDYAACLQNIASYLFRMGKPQEAINKTNEALAITKKTCGSDSREYAISLGNLAGYHLEFGNYDEAIHMLNDAMKIADKIGVRSLSANLIGKLAKCYMKLGKNSDALRMYYEALNIYENVVGKNHPDYARALSNLATAEASIGNNAKALEMEKEVYNIRKSVLGEEHPDCYTSMYYLSKYNAQLDNYSEALRIGKIVLDFVGKYYGKEHPDYANTLGLIADCYASMGNYVDALSYEKESFDIDNKIWGENSSFVQHSIYNLASYNTDLGNYSEGIRLASKALQINDSLYGKNNITSIEILNLLAGINSIIGNNTNAISLGTNALNILEKALKNKYPNYDLYASYLSNLALYYGNSGNYSEALRLATKSLKIKDSLQVNESVAIINNIAKFHYNLGNVTEAIQTGKNALQKCEMSYGKSNDKYAKLLSNLSLYYSLSGNYSEAIKLESESNLIFEKIVGKEHPEYANSLSNLAHYYFLNRDYSKIAHYASLASECKENNLLKNFTGLTSAERRSLWSKNEEWFQNNTQTYAYHYKIDSLITNAFNSILLSKGLLLNSEMEIRKLLTETNDEKIVDKYKELQINKLTLEKQFEKPVAERVLDTDSLERIIDEQERQLVEKCKAYGDYTKNLHIKWQDVQTKLGTEDASVEFVSFPIAKDIVMYIAYVLKKDMDCPKLVPLFEEKQLKKDKRLYTTSSASKLVWEPLAEYLKGVKNVYFAPSGELYNIGIESLPHWSEDCLMSDKWNMYRLSSTRQLVVVKDKNSLKRASVYGGVKYDTKEDLLLADSKRYQSGERSFNYELFEIADSLNLRSGAAYLPATKIEAEEIDRTLEQKKIATTLKLDTLATEGAFKDLSGKKTNLLHIATHGFYWTEKEAQYSKNLDFLMLGENQPKYVEDKALTRSGLLLAGANNALMGKKLPEGVDDGILTAKEISQLDLRGLDLVVLSACQTGLGEIKGDGVFGLQRGFKKAGANSLLMSLWKVDDEATRLLTTQFYKNLTSGMSKYESLKQAQKYVREYEAEVEIKSDEKKHLNANQNEQARKDAAKEKEFKKVKKYQDPYYWAAFILLDAID